jgi:hypothetical protein
MSISFSFLFGALFCILKDIFEHVHDSMPNKSICLRILRIQKPCLVFYILSHQHVMNLVQCNISMLNFYFFIGFLISKATTKVQKYKFMQQKSKWSFKKSTKQSKGYLTCYTMSCGVPCWASKGHLLWVRVMKIPLLMHRVS